MSSNLVDEIREYYRKRASIDRYATSPDFNLREVEIDYISRRLADGGRVLDVGCGNGYSTLSFAARYASHFVGIDFVPEMVAAAKEMSGGFKLKGTVEFQVGDATQLGFADRSFDTLASMRCLLNLPSRDAQWQALAEAARVLRPGGRYLMLEGTLQGLESLNRVRADFDLAPIPEAAAGTNWFSNKFDEREMLAKAAELSFSVEHIQRFGMYYLISRVIHPLLVEPESPRYDAKINAIARKICAMYPDFEGAGHVALFVLRRA